MNTTMKIGGIPADDVRETVEEAIADELEKLGGAGTEDAEESAYLQIGQITAVDITFVDDAGVVLEPAKEVKVEISSSELSDVRNPVLLRMVEVEGVKKLEDGTVTKADGKQFANPKDRFKKAELVKGVKLVNQGDEDESKASENTLKFETSKAAPFVFCRARRSDRERACGVRGRRVRARRRSRGGRRWYGRRWRRRCGG